MARVGISQAGGAEARMESRRESGCRGDAHEEGISPVWPSLRCPAKSLGRASSSTEWAVVQAGHVPGSRAVREADLHGSQDPVKPCSWSLLRSVGKASEGLLACPEGK